MSTMRDAGVVLVLILLAMTVRVDQPVGDGVVPEVHAAPRAANAIDLPAVQTDAPAGSTDVMTTEVRHEFRIVRFGLGEVADALEVPTLPSIVLATPEGEMRFVFVGTGPAPAPATTASPATVG